jgi:hypothetical protein
VTDHQETGAAAGDPRQASVEGRLSTPTRSLDFASVKVGFGARRPVPLTKPECLLSVQLRDLRRAHRKGRDAPIADLHSTRAWGMPLDYRLSYASLPEAG